MYVDGLQFKRLEVSGITWLLMEYDVTRKKNWNMMCGWLVKDNADCLHVEIELYWGLAL